MSWRDRLPTTSTRSGNPNFTAEAREKRRKELEEKRLDQAKKRQARKDFLAAGVSAPTSPSTSRVPSPVREHLLASNFPINPSPIVEEDDLLSLPDIDLATNMTDAAEAAARKAIRDAAHISENAPIFHDRCFEDDKEAWKKSVTIKFNRKDVEYFFTATEAQLKSFGINSQLSKRDALLPILPEDVIDECKPLLRIPEEEVGPSPYRDLKKEILKIFGKKPKDSFTRAMSRQMTGRPSALGKILLHDICPGYQPLVGCHCAPMVWGFWHKNLPQACKIGLADKEFNATTYKNLFDQADQIWEANGGIVTPAAEPTAVASVTQDSTVSAVTNSARGRGNNRNNRGRGANRGNRGNGRGGRGNAANANTNSTTNANPTTFVNNGPRSPDLPPPSCCSEHWKRGNSATFCFSPLDCPWKDRIVPRQNASKNTNNNNNNRN